MRRCLAALVVAAVLAVALTAAPSAGAAVPPTGPGYVAPVDAPVVDAFRPPVTPFGPGNRGFEYATTPGAPVRAAADGEVVFAGPVAGELHVVVLHPDGIRTSYSFLADVAVRVGDEVGQGDVVGTAGPRLFFGARVGDDYVDPAALLGGGELAVHLVPLAAADVDRSEERAVLADLTEGHRRTTGGAMAWLRRAGSAAAGYVADRATASVTTWRAVVHEVGAMDPMGHLLALVGAARRWQDTQQRCTGADVRPPPPPPGRRIAVLVGGLGSSSEQAAIDEVDTAALGYAAADVVRFSYAGGRTPDPTDGLAGIPARRYTSADSQRDLAASADALADLLRGVAAAAPGVPVDVIAHSQGGVVARLAVVAMAGGGGPAPGEGGAAGMPALLATLGSPHGGADLATAVVAGRVSPGGRLGLDLVSWLARLGLDPSSPAVEQLAETSAVTASLTERGLPAGVRAVSIAASGDIVVPTIRSRLPGAPLAVVPVRGPTAHDRLPGTAEATRELALALAGLPPTCESFADAMGDAVTAEAVSWSEDVFGLGAAMAGVGLTGPLPPP